MSKGECCLVILLCLLASTTKGDEKDGRKLFGGYKITPRFCKPTSKVNIPNAGPNICMFNHECATRQGTVVGACMDGFLFGACCQLPIGSAGELIESDQHLPSFIHNDLDAQTKTTYGPTYGPTVDVHSNGASHFTESFIDSAITTAQDNEVVQINGRPEDFGYGGVTHSSAPDTVLLNNINNDIDPLDFKVPGFTDRYTQTTDRSSTFKVDDHTAAYGGNVSPGLIQIAISHAPYLTTSQNFQKPMFKPRPTSPRPQYLDDKYILVPTLSHPRPNKTQELESIVNIIQLLNDTSTPVPFLSSSKPSTIYLQYTDSKQSTVSYPTSTSKYQTKATSRRPPSTPFTVTAAVTKRPKPTSSSKKPPSTSYVFSTTIPPRRTTQPIRKPHTTTRKPSTVKKPTYVYPPSTLRPGGYTSTTARPSTLKGTARPGYVTPAKPPSTSYVTGPTPPKRVPTVSSHVAGPSYTVVGSTPGYPTPPPPTVIVFAPVSSPGIAEPTRRPQQNSVTSTPKPKPVTQLTINNIVTANNNYHFSTSERPPPTVLITPKPPNGIITAGPYRPVITTEYTTAAELEIETSANDMINFPPVRNPNLNISASLASSEDYNEFTTPTFIEDKNLDKKVQTFVDKIVFGLQEPFNELKDVIYNTNKTSFTSSSAKPTTIRKSTTTRKPIRLSSSTRPTIPQRPTSKPVSTRKPSTRRPSTTKKTTTTTKPTTTTRRTKPTRRVTTTPPPPEEEEYDEDNSTEEELDYRRHCGIRPLMKSGRIVGGKGATFGAWPWQVLVRESTWLGLFTKNKCGGVLISSRFVVTAAHCQPGFLASLVAVFGEHDISGDLESKRPLSKNVKRVIVHRQYDAATFENDLALLELESAVDFDQHIVPICLPRADDDFTGSMATVTGWGRLKYGGGVPSVLQEVKVPIMENHVCQEMFRTAGHSKIILDSFLCAGYANGQKDSCEGDSGGPLVLQRHDGRWQLAGTVSHGIKCAAPYLPGVYMRTTYYKPWLESITGIH